MSTAQVVLSVIALTCTVFGVFWKIVLNTENIIKKHISELSRTMSENIEKMEEKIDKRHEENRTLMDAKTVAWQAVREQLLEKPSHDYISSTFARKDTTDLELRLINNKLDSVMKQLKIN